MQVKSITKCSKGSILQYFWPSLSYHLSLRSLFCHFLSGCFTQVLLYLLLFDISIRTKKKHKKFFHPLLWLQHLEPKFSLFLTWLKWHIEFRDEVCHEERRFYEKKKTSFLNSLWSKSHFHCLCLHMVSSKYFCLTFLSYHEFRQRAFPSSSKSVFKITSFIAYCFSFLNPLLHRLFLDHDIMFYF